MIAVCNPRWAVGNPHLISAKFHVDFNQNFQFVFLLRLLRNLDEMGIIHSKLPNTNLAKKEIFRNPLFTSSKM